MVVDVTRRVIFGVWCCNNRASWAIEVMTAPGRTPQICQRIPDVPWRVPKRVGLCGIVGSGKGMNYGQMGVKKWGSVWRKSERMMMPKRKTMLGLLKPGPPSKPRHAPPARHGHPSLPHVLSCRACGAGGVAHVLHLVCTKRPQKPLKMTTWPMRICLCTSQITPLTAPTHSPHISTQGRAASRAYPGPPGIGRPNPIFS